MLKAHSCSSAYRGVFSICSDGTQCQNVIFLSVSDPVQKFLPSMTYSFWSVLSAKLHFQCKAQNRKLSACGPCAKKFLVCLKEESDWEYLVDESQRTFLCGVLVFNIHVRPFFLSFVMIALKETSKYVWNL